MALPALLCAAAVPAIPSPTPNRTTLLFFNDHALSQRDNVERRVGTPRLLSEYVDPNNLTMNWAFPTVLPCELSSGGRGHCMLYQGFTETTAAQGFSGRPTAKYGVIAESPDAVRWTARDTTSELPHLPGRRFPNQVRPWDKERFGGAMAESECTMVDPLAAGTAEHYKMLLSNTKYSPHPLGGSNSSTYFASSDAIHWQERTWPFTQPVSARRRLAAGTGAARFPRSQQWSCGQGSQVFFGYFNPLQQRTTIVSRPDGSDRRVVTHSVAWGENFSSAEWSLDTDALDSPLSEVYGMPVVAYRGYFVALPWM